MLCGDVHTPGTGYQGQDRSLAQRKKVVARRASRKHPAGLRRRGAVSPGHAAGCRATSVVSEEHHPYPQVVEKSTPAFLEEPPLRWLRERFHLRAAAIRADPSISLRRDWLRRAPARGGSRRPTCQKCY